MKLSTDQPKGRCALLAKATNPDYRSCSTLTDCLDRDALAGVFEMMGKMIPDLSWKIVDVWVTEDKIVVLGEASGTPAETFWELNQPDEALRRSRWTSSR